MASTEPPLQVDMFTGESVDTRTGAQKRADAARDDWTQINMFSIQEVPLGILKTKPIVDISHLQTPALELVKVDTRTDEEKEAARRREMEANTYRLFDDPTLYAAPDTASEIASEVTVPLIEQQVAASDIPPPPPAEILLSPVYTAYLEIVHAAREEITTLWVDKLYAHRQMNRLPSAIIEAATEGLSASEITCAVQIGKFLGEEEKQASPTIDKAESLPSSQQATSEPCLEGRVSQPKGLRARLRQQEIPVRFR
jgi:hypothetical protein